jgi:hypothetical protein
VDRRLHPLSAQRTADNSSALRLLDDAASAATMSNAPTSNAPPEIDTYVNPSRTLQTEYPVSGRPSALAQLLN